MIDLEKAVALGARACQLGPKDPETTLAMDGLNARLAVAERVAARIPEFEAVVALMRRSNGRDGTADFGSGLMDEFDAIQRFAREPEVLSDVDFLVLFAGMLGFMERFEEPEKNDARIVLRALELISAKVGERDVDAVALVLMAYWFSDYRGYRTALANALAL